MHAGQSDPFPRRLTRQVICSDGGPTLGDGEADAFVAPRCNKGIRRFQADPQETGSRGIEAATTAKWPETPRKQGPQTCSHLSQGPVNGGKHQASQAMLSSAEAQLRNGASTGMLPAG